MGPAQSSITNTVATVWMFVEGPSRVTAGPSSPHVASKHAFGDEFHHFLFTLQLATKIFFLLTVLVFFAFQPITFSAMEE